MFRAAPASQLPHTVVAHIGGGDAPSSSDTVDQEVNGTGRSRPLEVDTSPAVEPLHTPADFIDLSVRCGIAAALASSTSPQLMFETAVRMRHVDRTREAASFVQTVLLLVHTKMQQIHGIMKTTPLPTQHTPFAERIRAAVGVIDEDDLLVPPVVQEPGVQPEGATRATLQLIAKEMMSQKAATRLVQHFYLEERLFESRVARPDHVPQYITWRGNFAIAMYLAYLSDKEKGSFTEVGALMHKAGGNL
jgi:hypothetical protein